MIDCAVVNRILKLKPFQLSVPSSFDPRTTVGRGVSRRTAMSVTSAPSPRSSLTTTIRLPAMPPSACTELTSSWYPDGWRCVYGGRAKNVGTATRHEQGGVDGCAPFSSNEPARCDESDGNETVDWGDRHASCIATTSADAG